MDSLVSTDRLVADAERAIRNVRAGLGPVYRAALLDARNKLRARAKDLAERLADGDRQYPHDGTPMPPRFEAVWLEIESEYRLAHNVAHRATQRLSEA